MAGGGSEGTLLLGSKNVWYNQRAEEACRVKVRRGTKGFTLIELFIVIAILGMLAAIAIPAYTRYASRAKIAGVVQSMGALKTAVSAYFVKNGGTPASADVTAIKRTFGVDIATQYATFQVDNTGVIPPQSRTSMLRQMAKRSRSRRIRPSIPGRGVEQCPLHTCHIAEKSL